MSLPSLMLLAACTSTPSTAPAQSAPAPRFVRDGLLSDTPLTGSRPIGDKHLLERPWSPGDSVSVDGWSGTAPLRAECQAVFHHELGDASRLAASGAPPPDTAMAFSPQGDRLAVGSYMGTLSVLDAWSGAVLAERELAESLLKFVAWSSDGQTLYAAEQSPSATVYALDPKTLETRWSIAISEIVESTPMPASDDRFGLYDLPASYGLMVLDDDSLILAAAHGWATPDGRRNLAQLLHVSPQGQILHRYPEQPTPALMWHPRSDGQQLLVSVTHSADTPPPAGMPVGGVLVLSLPDLVPTAKLQLQPLEPWFKRVFLWEALDIQGDTVLMGPSDGRVVLADLKDESQVVIELGVPVLAGEVPIAATIGHGLLNQGQALVISSETSIPWGAAAPELRPPSAHPKANALWSYQAQGPSQGELSWTWSGEQLLEGMTLSPDGHTLVVGAGPRTSDHRQDLYGALIFELSGQGTGAQRLQAFCATESPVFFRQAVSQDGRVAVIEHPTLNADGQVVGRYQLTVLR